MRTPLLQLWEIFAWSLFSEPMNLQRADLKGFFAHYVELGDELHGSPHFHISRSVGQDGAMERPHSALRIRDFSEPDPAIELSDSPLVEL
jgi:hypothetical protein